MLVCNSKHEAVANLKQLLFNCFLVLLHAIDETGLSFCQPGARQARAWLVLKIVFVCLFVVRPRSVSCVPNYIIM